MRQLEDTGIILGYYAHIDPKALDQSFEVLVDIELVDQTRTTVDQFEAAVIALDPIVDAKRMFGAPDYHAIVAVKDLAAYETFVTEQLMTLPGFARLQSRFLMKTLTSQPRIPLNLQARD